jgi:hypothetical protein
MMQDIPPALLVEANRTVLAHLEGKSTHSDIGDALLTSLKPLGDVQLYCPDWNQCRYVIASTQNFIFGFAVGMNTIVFRLDDLMASRALATGGTAYLECGQNWIAFNPFRHDWPRVDLEFWARKAYVCARENIT